MQPLNPKATIWPAESGTGAFMTGNDVIGIDIEILSAVSNNDQSRSLLRSVSFSHNPVMILRFALFGKIRVPPSNLPLVTIEIPNALVVRGGLLPHHSSQLWRANVVTPEDFQFRVGSMVLGDVRLGIVSGELGAVCLGSGQSSGWDLSGDSQSGSTKAMYMTQVALIRLCLKKVVGLKLSVRRTTRVSVVA